MLTRKHFIAIARILAQYRPKNQSNPFDVVPERLIEDLADWLHSTNDNFDRERFLRACNGEK